MLSVAHPVSHSARSGILSMSQLIYTYWGRPCPWLASISRGLMWVQFCWCFFLFFVLSLFLTFSLIRILIVRCLLCVLIGHGVNCQQRHLGGQIHRLQYIENSCCKQTEKDSNPDLHVCLAAVDTSLFWSFAFQAFSWTLCFVPWLLWPSSLQPYLSWEAVHNTQWWEPHPNPVVFISTDTDSVCVHTCRHGRSLLHNLCNVCFL